MLADLELGAVGSEVEPVSEAVDCFTVIWCDTGDLKSVCCTWETGTGGGEKKGRQRSRDGR